MTSLTCESGGWDMTRAQTECSLQPLSDASTGQLEDTLAMLTPKANLLTEPKEKTTLLKLFYSAF